MMCRKQITKPFTFFCYTEDPTDIIKDVNIVPWVDNNFDHVLHNKLFLFSEYLANVWGADTPCLFFDLDMIIHKNIDVVANHTHTALSVLRPVWKYRVEIDFGTLQHNWDNNVQVSQYPYRDHYINSSIMMWVPKYNYTIWDQYKESQDKFMILYHSSMDPYLFHECNIRGCRTLAAYEYLYCSFIYGSNEEYHPHIQYDPATRYSHFTLLHNIVVLNGPTSQELYDKFIKTIKLKQDN